jgi:hypothetical protein
VIARLTSGRRLRINALGEKEDAAVILRQIPSIRHVEIEDGAIQVEFEGDDATASDILAVLTRSGIRVSSFSQVDGGLEDAFMRATSEDLG